MHHPVICWVGFHILILFLLMLDLGFFHGKGVAHTFKKSCMQSLFWIFIALVFNLFIYVQMGPERALEFFTGYIVEKSLSVDNLFLFLLIFMHFRIHAAHQHKILFWGILGALVFRITLILAGVAIIEQYHFMFYIFGAFLFFSGVKFLLQKSKPKDPSKGRVFKLLSRLLPATKDSGDGEFFVRIQGKWKVTTLFLALLMIEGMDIVMALDSIPAIFAITTDTFIIYTSNVFALLGLRALYFVLAASLEKLKYLKYGLGAILIFVGSEMLIADFIAISLPIFLSIILLILGVTVLASYRSVKR